MMLAYGRDKVLCPTCGITHEIEREEIIIEEMDGFVFVTPILSPGCEHIGEFELLPDGRFEFTIEEKQ